MREHIVGLLDILFYIVLLGLCRAFTSGRHMEKALCEIIFSWQQCHPPASNAPSPSHISQSNLAINWNEISIKMRESGYELSPNHCLHLWMKLAYNLDELITSTEEVCCLLLYL
jgi:hypothetical protein